MSDQSGHWERALRFLRIVQRLLRTSEAAPDAGGACSADAVEQRLAALGSRRPPTHPVIIAGSTGSRGTTAQLMQAVARLPQGAVVLPGFDFDMPNAVWAQLSDSLTGEDHPQFRFAALLPALDTGPATTIRRWSDAPPPAAAAQPR